jgi:insertion element IS1 protein InsB
LYHLPYVMPEHHPQNNKSSPSCYFGVGSCPNCEFKEAIKFGFNKNGIQRFQCKGCKTTFMASYSRRYINNTANEKIKVLLKEGCGIRSIGRILKISAVTVIRKIKIIASPRWRTNPFVCFIYIEKL